MCSKLQVEELGPRRTGQRGCHHQPHGLASVLGGWSQTASDELASMAASRSAACGVAACLAPLQNQQPASSCSSAFCFCSSALAFSSLGWSQNLMATLVT